MYTQLKNNSKKHSVLKLGVDNNKERSYVIVCVCTCNYLSKFNAFRISTGMFIVYKACC